MSIAARSMQQAQTRAQDENSRFTAKQMKPAATATGRRAAGLSDITNTTGQAPINQGATKVRLFNI